MSRTFELLAREYGWDHRHIRERFTRRQLKLYLDRLNDRYRAQNEAIEKARESAPARQQSAGFVPWRVDHERARRAGEVTIIRGN